MPDRKLYFKVGQHTFNITLPEPHPGMLFVEIQNPWSSRCIVQPFPIDDFVSDIKSLLPDDIGNDYDEAMLPRLLQTFGNRVSE